MISEVYIKWIVGIVLLLVSFATGFLCEKSAFDRYKGEIKGMAVAQTNQTKLDDQINDEYYTISKKEYDEAINNLTDYYRAHPVVRMQHDTGSCTLPKTNGNSSGIDAATSGLYLGKYSEQDTEAIAIRLNTLQGRLRDGGVTIK